MCLLVGWFLDAMMNPGERLKSCSLVMDPETLMIWQQPFFYRQH
jgi:hypothetical protein